MPAAVAGLLLAGAAPAAAETVVPLERHVIYPQLAVSAKGDAVAAWTGDNSKYDIVFVRRTALENYRAKIRVALGSIDAGFPGRQTLDVVHDPRAGNPLLAGNRRGDAIVAWQDDRHRVRFAARREGGAFGPARTVASYGAPERLAAGPGGRFALAWASHGRLRVASGTARDGFGKPFRVSGHRHDFIDVAINARGTVLALVEARHVRAWLRHSGGRVEPAGRVPGWSTGGVRASLQPDDTVVVVYSLYRDDDGVAISYRPPRGEFTRPDVLDRHGAFPELAVDPRGAITAAWTIYDDGSSPNGIAASTAPPGGRFHRVIRFRRSGAWGGVTAAAGEGRRLVVFEQNGTGPAHPSRLRALAHGREGGFAKPVEVRSARPYEHAAGLADDGRGLVVWNAEHDQTEGGLFFARVGPHGASR